MNKTLTSLIIFISQHIHSPGRLSYSLFVAWPLMLLKLGIERLLGT